ncbi:MAG: hypothetical protein HQ567_29255 [Candidatus Nealsonbacteria bacterium]|nr:hypothetical protein [Candidatus Nealsonbacteria bacterium]
MKSWDLSTSTAKLDRAVRMLRRARADALEHWDDQTHHKFQENHLDPVEPVVRTTLDVVHRLEQVLSKAQRECEGY